MPARKPSKSLTPRQERTAWWLFVLRRVSGQKQAAVVDTLGLTAASSLSDLERAVTPASLPQLEKAADLYGVPLSLLTSPPMTDAERLAALLAGEHVDPDDPLIPLSVLKRLGREALARLATGDLSALQEATPATGEPHPQTNGGAAA